MKKTLVILATMMAVAISASAQVELKNLFVEEFVNNSQTNDITVKNLRQEIMSGITNTGRVNVVDASTLPDLPAQKRDRLKAMADKFDFVLEGTLNSILQQKSISKDKQTTYYEAVINYTLTLTDVQTGAVKGSETFKDSWSTGGTADEAVLKAIEKAGNRMLKYVNDNFKVEAVIKALDEIDQKKNAVKSCYVTVGSEMGIEKGQIFEVYANIEVAGEPVRKKVAELKAEEVMSGTLTHCNVKNGGAEIKKYFDDNIVLTVISRAKKDVLGIGSKLGL